MRHEIWEHRNQHAEADDVDEGDAEDRYQPAHRTKLSLRARRFYEPDTDT